MKCQQTLAHWKFIFSGGLILLIYSLLFYFQISMHLRMDCSSFYASALAYKSNINPYQDLVSTFLPIPTILPANLNPPAFFEFMSPWIHLDFTAALALWFLLSIALGIIGTLISFYLISTKEYFKTYWPAFILIYLAMYSTLMNSSIGQLGGLTFFCIMAGYYFFLRQQDYWAGLFWGCIIAIKLFPGLLFLFVLTQRRYKAFSVMLLCSLLLAILPVLTKGASIYSSYTHLLAQVTWYGEGWNGSLYGFISRLLGKPHYAKITYYLLFILIILWYSKKLIMLKKREAPHYAFSFTQIMMLFLSPFGWMYHFSLLIMPLALIGQALGKSNSSSWNKGLWVLSAFLINFPLGNLKEHSMNYFIYKISICSIYFYGLLIILYLLLQVLNTEDKKHAHPLPILEQRAQNHLTPIFLSLGLGLFIVSGTFMQDWVLTVYPHIRAHPPQIPLNAQ